VKLTVTRTRLPSRGTLQIAMAP